MMFEELKEGLPVCVTMYFFFRKKNTFSDLDWIFELREAILMSLDFLKSLLALLSLNMKTFWISMTLEKMAAMIRF